MRTRGPGRPFERHGGPSSTTTAAAPPSNPRTTAGPTLADLPLAPGTCLAVVARHFLDVWGPPLRPKTSSQKVRDRDGWRCMVPGCSHPADHAHHILYASHGGEDDPANLVGRCNFHHQRCIHPGYLRVHGTAPDGLTWLLGGRLWDGRPA